MGGLRAELDRLRPLHDLQHPGDPAAPRGRAPGRRACSEFIYASTSSIYGSDVTGAGDDPPSPVSPYGITKLAAEHLVQTYDAQFGLPSTILRYFSVYGPRQRPDMGYYLFIDSHPARAADHGLRRRQPAARQHLRRRHSAGHAAGPRQRSSAGAIYNIGGAEEISANQVIALLEEIIGKRAPGAIRPSPPRRTKRALADTTLAQQRLGFTPRSVPSA